MRFNYEYRTRENELKSGSLSASSRDAAYALLKKNGVNPSRMTLAPGLMNRLASFGWRVWLIVFLSVLLAVLAVRVSDLTSAPSPASPVQRTDDVVARMRAAGRPQSEIDEYVSRLRAVEEE